MKEKVAKEVCNLMYDIRGVESDINMLANTDDWYLALSLISFGDSKNNTMDCQTDNNIKDEVKALIIKISKEKLVKLKQKLEDL